MFHGVIDPQPGRLVFALAADGRIIHQACLEMHPRDASQVPVFIAEELKKHNLTVSEVPRWSFGCGPGSFTFLRVVTALGAGWAAANPAIRFRCITGAIALAEAIGVKEKETVAVIYDGRNKELLCFEVTRTNGILKPSGREHILNSQQAAEFFRKNPMRLAAPDADAKALHNYLDGIAEFTVAEPDLRAIINDPSEFDNNADRMCYIRPAVNTAQS